MALSHDVRLAIRLAARDRRVTLAVVAAMSLAIAANATVFALYNGLFLRPLPFESPDRIVVVNSRLATNPDSNLPLSIRQLREWRRANSTFTDLAAFTDATMSLSEVDRAPERVSGAFVSANVFRLLGVEPILGRTFRSDDERPGAPRVVLLSHRTWMTRYQATAGVIGMAVRVNGAAATVVGVMPARFGFPVDAAVWQPVNVLTSAARGEDERNLLFVARLAERTTLTQALADLTRVDAALPQASTNEARLVPKLRPFREFFLGRTTQTSFQVLLLGVVIVLAVACANVANLLLARGVRRGGEVALRMSMGARRMQVVRQLLIESLVLSAVSTLAGLVLSQAGVRLFERAIVDTGAPSWFDFSLDLRVFTFLALACGVTTVLFGLVPALHTTRTQLVTMIGQASRGSAALPGRRWSDVLVVAQFALTLTLLMSAGLVVRELSALRGMRVGVDTAGVTVMQLDLPRQQYATPEARLAFYARLDEQLERLPGARATYANAAPATGGGDQWLGLDGRPASEARNRRVSHMVIGPAYFDTLLASGTVRGRTFSAVERGDTVIINQRLAQLYFPDQDPIGMRIRFEQWRADIPASPWFTIVGVAPDIRQRSTGDRPVDPVVYTPYGYSGDAMPFATLIVRSSRPTADIAASMRALLRELDPSLPIFDVRSLDDALVQARWATRLFGAMFGVVASLALLLASVGLYGLTAYSVSLRTREIGIRMALGGRNRHIWWTVGRRGLMQTGVGLLVGAGGALAMGRMLQGMLPSASSATTPTLGAVAMLLLAVAATACFVPARRALRLNPVDALRAE